MSNELVKVEKLPMNEIMSISKAFAESGMFENIKSLAQAFVKIQAGQEIGIPPFAAMSGIHIIKGKPTIGAGIMASRLKGSGKYDYKVVEQTEKICSLDFFQGKEKIGNSTFTIEDAKKALTQNLEKFPRNMLFARAISNGVRWFTPDIFSGPVYTPEEMGEIETVTEDVPHTVVETPPAVEKPKPAISAKALNDAIQRIKLCELELHGKVLETFNLTPDQITQLDAAKAECEAAGDKDLPFSITENKAA